MVKRPPKGSGDKGGGGDGRVLLVSSEVKSFSVLGQAIYQLLNTSMAELMKGLQCSPIVSINATEAVWISIF